jgi:hypothetical protein
MLPVTDEREKKPSYPLVSWCFTLKRIDKLLAINELDHFPLAYPDGHFFL